MGILTQIRALLPAAVILGLMAGIAGVLPLGADEKDPNACDRMVTDLASLVATEDMYPYYLHAIGCIEDDGGAYVPDPQDGCMRTAYLLFITGSDVEQIYQTLTGNGECVFFEDGSYASHDNAAE